MWAGIKLGITSSASEIVMFNWFNKLIMSIINNKRTIAIHKC